MATRFWVFRFDARGHKGAKVNDYRRLPFACCALSLQPFDVPVATSEGLIFDLETILEWIKSHGTNPVTGNPLVPSDLIRLHLHKNPEGQLACPVTYKVFNDHTHIVTIKQSGNVYAFDAIQTLNIKPKNWTDLLTGEPFTRKDLITLQDPHNIGSRNMSDFVHLKQKEDGSTLNVTGSTLRILSEMSQKSQKDETTPNEKTVSFVAPKPRAVNAKHYSKGAAAASLTSTHLNPVVKNEAATFSDAEYALGHVTANGLVQIVTTMGEMQVELYCTDAPKASYNFIMLAKSGKYDNTKFHRVIPGFMAQGGDPSGTGQSRGDQSIYGKYFEDEFNDHLTHSSRGTLSMANKGKDTNSCQFFFSFAEAPHLDNKHTLFGKITKGMETLQSIEEAPVFEKTNEPREKILVLSMTVLFDPFQDVLDELDATKSRTTLEQVRKKQEKEVKVKLMSLASQTASASDSVGKYLIKRPLESANEPEKKKKSGFGNFALW